MSCFVYLVNTIEIVCHADIKTIFVRPATRSPPSHPEFQSFYKTSFDKFPDTGKSCKFSNRVTRRRTLGMRTSTEAYFTIGCVCVYVLCRVCNNNVRVSTSSPAPPPLSNQKAFWTLTAIRLWLGGGCECVFCTGLSSAYENNI